MLKATKKEATKTPEDQMHNLYHPFQAEEEWLNYENSLIDRVVGRLLDTKPRGVFGDARLNEIRAAVRFKEFYEKHRGIIADVMKERIRQDKKWGKQTHHPIEWLPILGEEVGEVNKAVLEAYIPGKSSGYSSYREELIQVAAVVLAMVECYDEQVNNEITL